MSDRSRVRREDDARGVATLTLDRPEVHNAFDDATIEELTGQLERLSQEERVRVVVLTGAGKSFSSGGDIAWMRATAGYDSERNHADALRLAGLMSTLDRLGKPTIARVNGAAFGGGVGLVACCDIVVAARRAVFGLPEVRLGLIPAVISPYVIAAIGGREARRYMLSGETIDAERARALHLVHEVVEDDGLDAAVDAQVELLLQAGPFALAECKRLIGMITGRDAGAGDALAHATAALIAALRTSPEGQEGLSAFLEKRRPGWRP